MLPSSRLLHLIQYISLAASTTKHIADSANVPILHSAAVLSLEIMDGVQTIKSNSEACIRVVETIHQILCAIIGLDLLGNRQPSAALLHEITNFTETLHRIYTLVKTLQTTGKIRQIFKQFEISSALESSRVELQSALEKFKIQTGISIVSGVADIQNNVHQQHEELLAFLGEHPESTVSDTFSDSGKSLPPDLSSLSLSMLPGRPKIFHGRQQELDEVVRILSQDSPRIAILGTGGMGKTSLATAALHHPEVSARYTERYFIGCNSTPTCTELLSTIAAHIGIEKGIRLSQRIYGYFLYNPPTLLILDNLETPWEPTSSRAELEEFLSLLADIPHLAILITMRGSERPAKIKWTRPFLEPLRPLSDAAALETFLAITDDRDGKEAISALLNFTGNLPLAVTLMANVAAHEGCDATLSRWRLENTQVLSDGYDQRSSLDISIMLSFSSSRMTGAAQDLLAVLSMLPEGLSDGDIVESSLPIPNIFACKTTLIRTALAYTDTAGRLKTLVPIQEHIRRIHPLPENLRLALRRHFHRLLELWAAVTIPSSPDSVSRISLVFANFSAVFLDGLERDDPDDIQTMQSIMYLNQFFRVTQRGWSPLMVPLSGKIDSQRNTPIYGKYLLEKLISCKEFRLSDAEAHIDAGNHYFSTGADLDRAAWNNALGIYYDHQGNLPKALAMHHSALALASADPPTNGVNTQAGVALRGIANILSITGDHVEAYQYAKKAEECSKCLGDVHWQAAAISQQVHCSVYLGDFRTAQALCARATNLLQGCGLQGGTQDLIVRGRRAEIHLLKTEYLESREINASIASLKRPGTAWTLSGTFAHHNLAVVDTALGAPSEVVLRNLSIAREQFNMAQWSLANPRCDATRATLHLREGEILQAKRMFETAFVSLRYQSSEAANFCLERLADICTGMSGPQDTLNWAGIYLASARKNRNKLAILKSLRFFGSLFLTFEDDETALRLFRIALDGFTTMEIHQWRAGCASQITTILARRGA